MKNFKWIICFVCILMFTVSCSDGTTINNVNKTTSIVEQSTTDIKLTENKDNVSVLQNEKTNDSVKVINDIANWDHPTKEILGGEPFNLYKVELLHNGIYPKFYVKYPNKHTLEDKKEIINVLGKLATANGFWDCELINEENEITIQVVCEKKAKKINHILVNGLTYYSIDQQNEITHSCIRDSFNVPQIYKDYIKDHDISGNSESILFYSSEDIDLDGKAEVVIAAGYADKDPTSSFVEQLYILRENNGKIEQLGENLAQGGYGVYEVNVIRLQDRKEKYIYCGLTNGANLLGFEIIKLADNKPDVICYSASATGAGDDKIEDFNNDGQYDGYTQNRWSYDVLYYPMIQTYSLQNNQFVLEGTKVEMPEYPTNIKDVIIQYLSLRVIDVQKSPEADKRLSELCNDSKAANLDFLSSDWYSAVYNTIQEFDDMMKFDIKETKNTADVIVSFKSEDNKNYKCVFNMTKQNGRWCINKIN